MTRLNRLDPNYYEDNEDNFKRSRDSKKNKNADLLEQDYIKNNGEKCPFCKSDDLVIVDDLHREGKIFIQEVECQSCEKTWKEVFKLIGLKN
jgi:transposase-like protein